MRKVIKGSRWLLLRNRRDIGSADYRIRLYDLLDVNRSLMKVYVLKEDLKQLWDFHYPKAAKGFWKDWDRRAMQSGIEPLRRFAKRLKPYVPGILDHCRHRLRISLPEGIHNKIMVISAWPAVSGMAPNFNSKSGPRFPELRMTNEKGPALHGTEPFKTA